MPPAYGSFPFYSNLACFMGKKAKITYVGTRTPQSQRIRSQALWTVGDAHSYSHYSLGFPKFIRPRLLLKSNADRPLVLFQVWAVAVWDVISYFSFNNKGVVVNPPYLVIDNSLDFALFYPMESTTQQPKL